MIHPTVAVNTKSESEEQPLVLHGSPERWAGAPEALSDEPNWSEAVETHFGFRQFFFLVDVYDKNVFSQPR